jgi:hypothetical protein
MKVIVVFIVRLEQYHVRRFRKQAREAVVAEMGSGQIRLGEVANSL